MYNKGHLGKRNVQWGMQEVGECSGIFMSTENSMFHYYEIVLSSSQADGPSIQVEGGGFSHE